MCLCMRCNYCANGVHASRVPLLPSDWLTGAVAFALGQLCIIVVCFGEINHCQTFNFWIPIFFIMILTLILSNHQLQLHSFIFFCVEVLKANEESECVCPTWHVSEALRNYKKSTNRDHTEL